MDGTDEAGVMVLLGARSCGACDYFASDCCQTMPSHPCHHRSSQFCEINNRCSACRHIQQAHEETLPLRVTKYQVRKCRPELL